MRFAVLVLASAILLGQSASGGAPFRMTWIHGACRNCETARYLVDVPYFSSTEAWAIGFNPPGQTGSGDATVLHSRNGGRTWLELHRTYIHNGFPTVSFAGPRDGWLMHFDMSETAQRLVETHDGGRHWRRIKSPDNYMNEVQYLGQGRGLAYAWDFYKKLASFYVTTGGGHWRKITLPPGFEMGEMNFTDLERGILVGCQDHRLTVLNTGDGGQHWAATNLALPRIGDQMLCDGYETDRLTSTADGHAWLLVSKRSFGKDDTAGYTSAWASVDGGRTWNMAFEQRFDTGKAFSWLRSSLAPPAAVIFARPGCWWTNIGARPRPDHETARR